MAAAILFQGSPSIKKAAIIINGLDGDRFSKVLSRVLQRFHIKDEPIFNEEESAKLQSGLGVESQDLMLLVDTSSFFFQQAAYNLAKPALFQKQLVDVGMEEDKASLFSQLWAGNGKAIVEKLRSTQFYPIQLEEVKWRLNLRMSQSTLSHLKEPNAMFELGLSGGKDEGLDRVRLEFNHSELYNFYEKLESIQEQLDSLN